MRIGHGFDLGSIAGVRVSVDWSLSIIFLLITFSLAIGVFPAWHPGWGPLLHWGTALVAAVLFFASVLAHELSHAIVGRANGINIRRITLFVFGGMAHMEDEPPTWRAEFGMAIVGPITSLLLGVTFLWLAGVAAGGIVIDPEDPQRTLAQLGPLPTLLIWLGPINILLGLFNLVPGFPLDGGRVLRAAIWGLSGDLHKATRWASLAGQGFAWLLIATGFAMMLGLRVPIFGTGFIGGLWLAVIGWFLNNAAQMSYQQLVFRSALENVPAQRLMQTTFTRVEPRMRLGTLIEQHLMATGQRAFPVVEDGRLLGLVSVADLQRQRENADWDRAEVAAVMTPVDRLTTIAPRQPALDALQLIGEHDYEQLPVLDRGKLVGLLRREDILKWLSLRLGPTLGGVHQR